MKNFWQEHGIFFLIFITFFPRLTMLFATKAHFGPLAWLGWLLAPHLTVAILATQYYWHTNPILCIIAWFMAFAGTGGEWHLGRKIVETNDNYNQKRLEQVMIPIHDPIIEKTS